MRLIRFLNENNDIQKALNFDEPEIGKEYDEDIVREKVNMLEKAVDSQKKVVSSLSDEEKEAAQAVLSDLQDKLKKWKNWKEEVKEVTPEPKEEPAPDDEERRQFPEEEDETE